MTQAFRAGHWRTWDELAAHIDSGEMRETHTVEFKTNDVPGGDGARKELARDIAALAIDGGFLVLGIAEDKVTGVATEVTPIPLLGAGERIDQICGSRISPPLAVQVRELADPRDPSMCVLVIEVPATGVPHMVDHAYFGRGNRQKRRLDHLEVVRLMSHRDGDLATAAAALDNAATIMDREGMSPNRLVISVTPIPMLREEALRDRLVAGAAYTESVIERAAAYAARRRMEHEALTRLTRQWNWTDRFSLWGTRRIPGGLSIRFGHPVPGLLVEVLESGAARFAWDNISEETKDPDYRDKDLRVVYLNDVLSFACVALAGARGSSPPTRSATETRPIDLSACSPALSWPARSLPSWTGCSGVCFGRSMVGIHFAPLDRGALRDAATWSAEYRQLARGYCI